jgi:hypothetical protein
LTKNVSTTEMSSDHTKQPGGSWFDAGSVSPRGPSFIAVQRRREELDVMANVE